MTRNQFRTSAKLTIVALLLCGSIGCRSIVNGKKAWMQYPPAQPVCEMQRAGWSNYVSNKATYAYGKNYGAYYVGGGSASKKADPRTTIEGTFGVDYAPRWSRVALGWSHGLRYQDGRGHYEPDHTESPFKNYYKFGNTEGH